MPQFDLRNIKAAKYVNTQGTVTYTNATKVGDAMTANLELRNAEGRLFAESALSEYMRKATGGTISLGVKYLSDAVQQMLFGATAKSRTVSYTVGTATETEAVAGVGFGAMTEGSYVGVAFYAPDMRDGVLKYFCCFIPKALFGPPSLSLQTAGENIVFQTPVTSGEFLASDAADKELYETAVCSSEAAAKAWVDAVLGVT